MALIGVFFYFMWIHLERRPQLLVEGITREQIRQAESRSLVGPIVYGLSIGIAFISAWACLVIYALIAIYFARGPSSKAATPLMDAGIDADADPE
jgi:hypothetical protein